MSTLKIYSYTLALKLADVDAIWWEAEAHGAYMTFTAFGDCVIHIRDDNPYNTQFALKYHTVLAHCTHELYIV